MEVLLLRRSRWQYRRFAGPSEHGLIVGAGGTLSVGAGGRASVAVTQTNITPLFGRKAKTGCN